MCRCKTSVLLYRYLKPLCDPASDEKLTSTMLTQASKSNELQGFVEERGLTKKRIVWKSIEEIDAEEFPRLSGTQLSQLTLGVYQLRLAPSYIQDLVGKSESEYSLSIKLHIDIPGLLCVKMPSRHQSSKSYYLYVRYTSTDVTAWYCQCKAGARVVGTCSHVASVLWWLCHARHRMHVRDVGVRNWGGQHL